MIQNKAPGKDVSIEDMEEKFPLTAKKDKSHTSTFEIAGTSFGGKLIPVMAGPNMVENENLIVETAIQVKKAGAHFLRGGAPPPLLPALGARGCAPTLLHFWAQGAHGAPPLVAGWHTNA